MIDALDAGLPGVCGSPAATTIRYVDREETSMSRRTHGTAWLATGLAVVGALVLGVVAMVPSASAATKVRASYGPVGAIAQDPSGGTSSDFTAVTSGTAVVLTPQRVITEGDFQWMTLGLPWDNGQITSVRVCYKVVAAGAGGTYISQTRLSDMTVPPTSAVKLDDGTNRTSTAGACYTVATGFTPSGAVTLGLKVVFGSTADRIMIGAIQLGGQSAA
jgi:hypothetical protein